MLKRPPYLKFHFQLLLLCSWTELAVERGTDVVFSHTQMSIKRVWEHEELK